jgi:hypothetical protein
MKRIFFGLAAGVLALATAGTASAHPVKVVRGRAPVARVVHRDHGIRFAGGHYDRGRDHFHWTRRVWDVGHRRYQYWDPYYSCWYFYDPIRVCYYPC